LGITIFIHVVILLDLNLWTTMYNKKVQESTKTKTLGHSSLMVQENNEQIPSS
jgi:regulatory protein YycI of two-component signal transduction system YycFG